jgi:hypothetical protein
VMSRGSVGQTRHPLVGPALVVLGFVCALTLGISIAVAPAVALAMGACLVCSPRRERPGTDGLRRACHCRGK